MSKTNGGISPTTVDLSPWINTNFTSLPTSLSDKNSHAAASQSFNFSQFERLIHHKNDIKESKDDTPLCPSVWCVDCEDGLIILGKCTYLVLCYKNVKPVTACALPVFVCHAEG